MSSELILHHFDLSPFAEKIRLLLGSQNARWRSVQIPMVMPKPDVLALTGGYRRTPQLQIGADVWCDTALIARVLDRRLGIGLFPSAHPLAPLLAQWADWTLFWSVIDFVSQPACVEFRFGHMSPEERSAIAADRTPFRSTVPRLTPADSGANLQVYLGSLQAQLTQMAQLAHCGDFLFGPLTVADFSVAHCLWHLRRGGPPAVELVDHFPGLLRWHDRMLAFGHGRPEELASGDALHIAAGSKPEDCSFHPEPGLDQGMAVSVAATDYGLEPSEGTLVGLNTDEVVIARRDARAGTVHVHFPRAGFRITPLAA